MSAFRFVAPVFVVLGLAACGGADDSQPENEQPTGQQQPPGLEPLSFETGEFVIPPGDSFECFYTGVVTDQDYSVVSATGHQGPGGHHIVAYYTDLMGTPEHHPCKDEEMIEWHQVVGASEGAAGAEGLIGLPEGLAIKLPKGKQIVLQAHYINTSGAPMTVSDKISMNLVEPEKVQAYANYYVMLDIGFNIAPMSQAKRTSICTLKEDLDAVTLLGHMHELGTHYKLERLGENDAVAEVLYDEPWDPSYASHPPVKNFTREEPLKLPKGTRVRQTCEWDNTTPESVIFPREMCLAFLYYYPDAGEIICANEVVE